MPAVGGALNLAVGARRLWVVTEHTTKEERPRVVRRCSCLLTAPGVVSRVDTSLPVLDVTECGFAVRETVPTLTLPARTEAALYWAW